MRENATIDKRDGITHEPRGISGTVHFPVYGKAALHTRCRVHFLLFRSRNLFLERPAVMSLVMQLFCMQREVATLAAREMFSGICRRVQLALLYRRTMREN
jgi:hypothetical protein